MRWNDLPPDAKPLSISDLAPRLGFVDAIRLLKEREWTMPVVLLQSDVADRIWQHAKSDNVELGGLMVGRVFAGEAGEVRAVEIIRAVPSEHFHSTSVSLNMSPRVWQEAAAYRGANLNVVGWYHTHPNLGAFFSSTDRATQRSFFREPYSLGLVVDPIRNEEAWFVGAESQPLVPQQVRVRV
ncbi:Mov34/MPN/PAD-1 family protein [Cupriavidus sp. amp6]|uniref:Mov34/MPN/PAD-1 family protein n=1 Tax=Cupriavidus sp. amp6 TaxID=388051 RepID=UPI000A024006